MTDIDPHDYVREHRDDLTKIIKHSDDDFTRALAIVTLVKYGSEPDVEQVQHEIETARQVVG